MSQYPPDGQLDLVCPHCQSRVLVGLAMAGQIARCPICTQPFEVPVLVPQAAFGTVQTGFQSHEVQSVVARKLPAGLCGIMLGALGIHKFILGFTTAGLVMLLCTGFGIIGGICMFVPIIMPLCMSVIGFIEGILYLIKTDEEFFRIYGLEKREWF